MPSNTPAIRKVIYVKDVEQKTTQKGRPMWTITDDQNDFYSVFDEFVRARIIPGQHNAVMVKTEDRNGKMYKNISGMAEAAPIAGDQDLNELRIDGSNPPAPAAPLQTPVAPIAPVQRAAVTNTLPVDIRYQALSLAVGMFNAGTITHDQIEANANEFLKYIIGEQNSYSNEATNVFAR